MTLTVSLIIATRNRADSLRACLASITRLDPGDWELIVIDDGSTDATPEVLQAFSREARIPFQAIHKSGPGLSEARNLGAAAARGEILAFTDDDCYPAPDFIEALRHAFEDPRLGFVGGRVLLHDPEDLPITIQASNRPVHYPPVSFLLPGTIHGANMAVRKVGFEQVGGFGTWIGPGTRVASGEDIDLLARLSAAGWEGAYDPRPLVFHHHRRRGKEALRSLLDGYAVGRGAYYANLLTNPKLRWVTLKTWWRNTNLKQHRRRLALELKGAWYSLPHLLRRRPR